MAKSTFCFLAISGMLLAPTAALAADINDNNPRLLTVALTAAESTATPSSTGQPPPLKRWFNSDIVRYSWGFGPAKLRNPVGFDLSSEVYAEGQTSSLSGANIEPTLSLSMEKRIAKAGQGKRVWTLALDRQDFDGLELTSFMVGYGYALSPPSHRQFGFRIAGGIAVGITRSSTFFDDAFHSSVEAWASVGVQFKRFVIDIVHRDRKTIESTLDERSAGPIIRSEMLTFGLLF